MTVTDAGGPSINVGGIIARVWGLDCESLDCRIRSDQSGQAFSVSAVTYGLLSITMGKEGSRQTLTAGKWHFSGNFIIVTEEKQKLTSRKQTDSYPSLGTGLSQQEQGFEFKSPAPM